VIRNQILLLFCLTVFCSCYCYQDHLYLEDHYLDLAADDFPGEIDRLLDLSRNHPNPNLRARAHLHLARLYLHRNNPRPGYQEAIRELRAYLSRPPKIRPQERDHCLNQIALCTRILELSQMAKDMRRQLEIHSDLRSEWNTTLRQKDREIARLKQELSRLEEKIKKLDSLYFQIQKKKKKDR